MLSEQTIWISWARGSEGNRKVIINALKHEYAWYVKKKNSLWDERLGRDGDGDNVVGLYVIIVCLDFSHNEMGCHWSALSTKV